MWSKQEGKKEACAMMPKWFSLLWFQLFSVLNFRNGALTPWERARRVAGWRLVALGEAADRALSSWVESVWRRLRKGPSVKGYSATFSQPMERLIWEVLEAEFVEAADDVVKTDARVCVSFCSAVSAARVFFPNRFVGLCRHGGSPLFREFGDGSSCGVLFCCESPFRIVYSKTRCVVTVSFDYMFTNAAGFEFHNEY